jgi:hypothetical protein
MALAGRSARRSGTGRRWLVIGVVITLLVLLVDASLKSRSPAPARTLAAQAWMDRILPIIQTSTEEGRQVTQIRSNGLHMSQAAITGQLNQVASGALAAYRQAVALSPPAVVAGAAGLLEASLLVRSQGAAMLANGLNQLLTTRNASSLQPLTTAGQDFQISDRAYQLFTQNLPPLGATVPASVWVSDGTQYDPTQLSLWTTTLRNATTLTPAHQLRIVAVSTNPGAVSQSQSQTGSTPLQILPVQNAIGVTIVVADVGNQPENNLTIRAAIAPSLGASSVRDFMNLTPGQAQSITIGPLNPVVGQPTTLTVTVTPPSGSPTPAQTQALTFEMPSLTSSSTTTTTTPATTTTLPSTATTLPGSTSPTT